MNKNNINKIFCMDNIDLMKQISNNYIDLIYCDILYGTGKIFKDYKDIKSNRKEVFEFYSLRFEEMHRLLKNTGSIYIHCNWRISHYIRLIMDNIFGYSNFINEIIWEYTGGGRSKTRFSNKHDNIFIYSKSNVYAYNIDDVRVPYSKKSGYAKGGIISSKGKKYLPNPKGTPVTDVWYIPIINPLSKERTNYFSQKPEALLERIIKASSNKGDLIADFFCGSGTTLAVAKKLGRNYIGCDINLNAINIAEKRLSIILK